ncbi:hypothetical protein BDR26DRAFT_873836 [Obelidium mucronatum]|nr:hypothetical protein BDR26DRAFT_873836 [Obelidium mucronatum]
MNWKAAHCFPWRRYFQAIFTMYWYIYTAQANTTQNEWDKFRGLYEENGVVSLNTPMPELAGITSGCHSDHLRREGGCNYRAHLRSSRCRFELRGRVVHL